jgi:hypothetical protein
VTSRFFPEITEPFVRSVTLEIRASAEDVRRYVNSYISRLPLFVGRNPDLQEKIRTEIVKAVNSMYVAFT